MAKSTGETDALTEALARIKELEEQVSKVPTRALSCKVSEKGAVSVYGLNARWPITLYGNQWERLAAYMPKVTEFVQANASKLSVK